jgi:amicyanin
VFALVASVIAGAILLMPASSHAASISVSIEHYAFAPGTLEVHVGDTVTWTNKDSAPHTVTGTSGPEKLDSPTLEKGDTWSFTFTKPGTYEYYCAIHPDMVGKIVVTGSASPAPAPTTTTTAAAAPGGGSGSGGMDGMEPSPSDSPTSSGGSASSPASPASCSGLSESVLAPFVVHFDKAHLERSPGGQVSDALNVDQYAKTHTVLFEAMLAPLFHLVQSAPSGLNPFVVHFDKAHLERSPAEQVSDALNADQYAKTHTVLFEAMLAPTTGAVAGTSC